MLYQRKLKGYIQVEMMGKLIELTLNLVGMDNEPDCCMSHYGLNFYLRTPYGNAKRKYSSLGSLKRSCGAVLKGSGITPKIFTVRQDGNILLSEAIL